MEFYTLLSLIIAALIAWWYLVVRESRRSVHYIESFRFEELNELIDNQNLGYYLIDTRSTDAFEKGHIPTAINLPSRDCAGILPTDDLFMLVVVYGGSRREAMTVANILSEFGYFNVQITDPISHWKGRLEKGL